jgi:hypothetical protein
MNKLKNVGISALAGSLISLSAAEAGGVSVSGSWELRYTNLNHEKVTGNKLGMNKNLSFGASGDVSDGGGVTWATTIGGSDALGLSSASMNINMLGIATLAYDSGTGGYGANAVDNIVPTAWEEIDYGLSTGITDVGAVSATKGSVHFSINAPKAGTGFSVSYAPRMGTGHQADGATGEGSGGAGVDVVIDFINYDSTLFGWRFGVAGEYLMPEMTCDRQKKDLAISNTQLHSCQGKKDEPYAGTMYTKLHIGPLHLGTQATFKNPQDNAVEGILNKRAIVGGAALVFGDTLSLSYGEAWDRYRYNNRNRASGDGIYSHGTDDFLGSDFNEYETIRYRGWSAALNLGPLALKGTRNKVGGKGEGGSSAPKSHSEVNLSLAF